MTTYLIGARARYVLVDADNEQQARVQGEVCLKDLYAHFGLKDVPVEIRTVRPATAHEIQLWNSHRNGS